MKLFQKLSLLVGIGAFLLVQQCAFAQEDAGDVAIVEETQDEDTDADIITQDEEEVDANAVEDPPATDEAERVSLSPESDPRMSDEAVEALPVENEGTNQVDPVPQAVCIQAINDDCIEDKECCQGYTCHHENKKCKSNGNSFAPLQPNDPGVINFDNDIIE